MKQNNLDHIRGAGLIDKDLATRIEALLKEKESEVPELHFKVQIKKKGSISFIVSKARNKDVFIEMPIETENTEEVISLLIIMLSDENVQRYKRYLELLDKRQQTEVEIRRAKMVMDRIETAMRYSGIDNIEVKSF